MTGEQLVELFGDVVTQLTGNPYTGKPLTVEQIENIFNLAKDKAINGLDVQFLDGLCKEKARESDPAR